MSRTVGLGVLTLVFATEAFAQSIQTVAGGGGTNEGRAATLAVLPDPRAMLVHVSGDLFVTSGLRIWRVSKATGTISAYAGTGSMAESPDGLPATKTSLRSEIGDLAVDRDGNVVFALGRQVKRVDRATGLVSTVAGSLSAVALGDGGPAPLALMDGAWGLALAPDGSLLIAERGGARIRRVDPQGTITTFAGTGERGVSGDGGPATAARFVEPFSLAVDGAGNLYVSDYRSDPTPGVFSPGRIRRVDAGTGRISTVAGTRTSYPCPPYSDGPALEACLPGPAGLALDREGNLYWADETHRIRRVSPAGQASSVAGNPEYDAVHGDYIGDYSGDGGPATLARLNHPYGVAIGASGELYVGDTANGLVRRVAGGTIATFAGTRDVGDGRPATAAILSNPGRLALRGGDLLIADSGSGSIRRASGSTGRIERVAGGGRYCDLNDGQPATTACVLRPTGAAWGDGETFLVADTGNNRIRFVDAAGRISTAAGSGLEGDGAPGGFSGDGGPASLALLKKPQDVVAGEGRGFFVIDSDNHRIRAVSPSGDIQTIAGGDRAGYAGDGLAATAALLSQPGGAALDTAGDLLVADSGNSVIRKIALRSGTIATVAGTGQQAYSGDFGPPLAASFSRLRDVAADRAGAMVVADTGNHVVRRIAGTVQTIAGTGVRGDTGDGGPATLATLNDPSGVEVDADGNVFISDQGNNRIRAVFACVPVTAPELLSPGAGATAVDTQPNLSWRPVKAAFRYDVLLDTQDPPLAVVARDVTGASLSVSNLGADRLYYWRVVAKGDPFCSPPGLAASPVRSFRTGRACTAPAAPALLQPADAAQVAGPTVTLAWQPQADAAVYDVYYGVSDPPPLRAAGLSASELTVPVTAGATVRWAVVARAACDEARASEASARGFVVAGACEAPGAFQTTGPGAGTQVEAPDVTLSWTPSRGAAAYDLYLGSADPPPLHATDLAGTSYRASALVTGTTYRWFVQARTPCLQATATTGTAAFQVVGCREPEVPTFSAAPARNVNDGRTYVLTWNAPANLDAGGGYLVERSTDPAFTAVLDEQITDRPSATFVAPEPGSFHHRVQALSACGRRSGRSAVVSVVVEPTPVDVVFSTQPPAVVAELGDKIEEKKAFFTLENLGTSPVTLRLAVEFLDSEPIAFFLLRDPLGGPTDGFVLSPRTPKLFEIQFQGASNAVARAYGGRVSVARVDGKPLANAPAAFVSLRVGAALAGATPLFRINGVSAEIALFSGVSGEDAGREPLTVEILNPGPTPMDVAAEIGPELWLTPEAGWNATAIPPGAARQVRLHTKRTPVRTGPRFPGTPTSRCAPGRAGRPGCSSRTTRRPRWSRGALRWPIAPAARPSCPRSRTSARRWETSSSRASG